MAGLSFDSRSSNSAFLSAGILSADSIADLVFSMCSSIIYALPLTFYDVAFRFADTLEWDAPRNNLRFQKSSPTPSRKEFPQRICVGRRGLSTQSFSILFAARVDWPGH